ncbi:SCP-like protein [Teladorsagia circumcincta]|uniref:SCP-like protein n=1 Tax=Teladorsagia circumcincta TaxID=45464 RepID=A0A2G9UPW1_TELCI|nr:SCP-like protein [Teladorsagia circumcincta]
MLALFIISFLVLQPAAAEAAHCSLDNGMTDELRQIYVDKHNEYRSIVARGLAVNKLGGFAPKAAKMLKVSYDCDIEQNMMEWLKQCKYAHSPYSVRNGWGQNLFMVDATKVNKTKVAPWSVRLWFDELAHNGVPQENVMTRKVFGRGIGHYSQVVWQNSNKIGCGIFWCEKMTYAGCEYSPAGNFIGALIYEIGEPCSKCDCEGCKCNEEDGLCTAPENPIKHKKVHERHHNKH